MEPISNERQVHPEQGSVQSSPFRPGKKGYKLSSNTMGRAGFWQQLKTLLWRNIKLKSRNKGALAQELIFPIYFVAILAMIKILTKPSTKPSLDFPSQPLNSTLFGLPFMADTEILVAPGSSQYETWIQDVVKQLYGPPKYRMFNSSESAEAYYVDAGKDTRAKIAAGVVFNYNNDPNAYAIRMNGLPGTTDTYNFDKGTCRDIIGGIAYVNCPPNTYMSSGFAQLQVALENVVLGSLGVSSPDPTSRNIQVQMLPKEEYTPNTDYLQTISSIYFILSFSFMVSSLAVNIVSEKEKKIKDGMMMMGLRSSVFWISWTIIYMAMIFAISCVIVIIIVASEFFTRSNMFLIFLAFLLYGGSFVAFVFMITPFFSKAKTAGGVAALSTTALGCIYLAISQTRSSSSYDSSVDPSVQWLLCLISPVAFATFIDQGIYMDIHLGGFGFNDSMTYGKFPLYAPLLMLFLDILLYAVLTLYLDKVVPSEYGVRYHPLFFLQSDFWCPSKGVGERTKLMKPSRSVSQAVDVEPVGANMEDKVAMRMASLTKSFKVDKKLTNAVDGFCLDIYEGHITCLLGHNGAGKTTLMNMLTGVVSPTSGTATIMGLDITRSSDMEKIRSLCGICPQHNILYNELSCREHLKIFANIKGVPEDQVAKTIENALLDVDLVSQGDTFAKNLSGGQKRKLSVAIALIGDPKLIFLDEPTAGMDPFSRRHLWSLLKRRKEGRVVLLTTHFMDEADILSDRKAFISKGKLRCCGSSLFLKNKFGVGYHLTMVAESNCNVERVTTSLQDAIPDIQLERSHGKEISYTVPLADVGNFSALFGMLDSDSAALGIKSYGVSMTTLEEVFLKLEGADNHDEGKDFELDNPTFGISNEHVNLTINNGTAMDFGKALVKGSDLTKQKFKALLRLRCILTFRDTKALLGQVVLPVIFVIVSLVVSKTGSGSRPSRDVTPLEFKTSLYAGPSHGQDPLHNPLLLFDASNDPTSAATIARFEGEMPVEKYVGPAQNLSGIKPHFFGLQLNQFQASALTDFNALYNYSALHAIPILINLASRSMLNASVTLTSTSLPWPDLQDQPKFDSGVFTSGLLLGIGFIILLAGFAWEIVRDRELKLRGQLRISGVSFNLYWGTIYLRDIVVYLIPCLVILIVVIAMDIPGLNSEGAIVSLVLMFLTNVPFNILMIMVISFMFDKAETATSYLPSILQLLGMVPYVLVSLIDMITQSSWAYVLHYIFCATLPPYMIFGGFYFISRVYLYSEFRQVKPTISDYFATDNHIVITIIMPLVHFVWMYWLLRVLDVRATAGKVREAFPCLARRLDTDSDLTYALNDDVIEDEDEDVTAERRRVENFNSDSRVNYSRSSGIQTETETKMVAHTNQVRKTFTKRTERTGLCKKPKPGTEKIKVAVRNLSIGVDKGEVLGLLGPNGAGKSTALNMMIAETAPTKGKVVVSGHNVRANALSVLESLGYCPQHDALWETITLEEHVRCFAAIKGIHPSQLEEVIDYCISNLKLEEHRMKGSKKLSGGTKRKLSYIMSMLGSPHLVLMDEPSTGMDPQSKRFLWDTINASFKGTSKGAILTTHYMEEADALCDRVGIMVNGALECLGSTQHLKSKYGSGYILEVKLSLAVPGDVEELMDKLEEYLKTLFPNMSTVERFMERAQYAIPKEDVTSLGTTFSSLEQCKSTHSLEEYSFSQSSLEQVFLHFAKQQLEEGEEDEREGMSKTTRRTSSLIAPQPV